MSKNSQITVFFFILALFINLFITSSSSISTIGDIEIYDVDGVTILENIDFGDFHRGETKRFPESGNYWVKNTGDQNIYLSWSIEGLPTDVKIYIYGVGESQGNFTELPEGQIYSVPITPGLRFLWYIEIEVSTKAEFNDYRPVITWRMQR